MPGKPIFLFVPGNFLPPNYYDATTKHLWARGYESRLVTLPSTGAPEPLPSNEPDVLAIRRTLEEELNYSYFKKNVIIVAHGYGSIPTCEALKGFEYRDRIAQGKPNGVIRMIIVAGWLLNIGVNVEKLIKRYAITKTWKQVYGVSVTCNKPKPTLFNDLPKDVANYWVSQTTHSDYNSFYHPQGDYIAWNDIPTTYLVCLEDHFIPEYAQWGMAEWANGAVKIVEMDSGHLPMLSKTEKFVEFLDAEAGEACDGFSRAIE